MPIARCPVCDDILTLGPELALSQPITCSTCLSNLKVVSVEPCELEEANRRPPRPAQGGQYGRSYPQGGRRDQPQGRRDQPQGRPAYGGAPGNNRPAPTPPPDRRLPVPKPPPAFPPNPDKLVDTRRAQKWEKPKEDEPEHDKLDEYEEFEDKLNRNKGKGKKGK